MSYPSCAGSPSRSWSWTEENPQAASRISGRSAEVNAAGDQQAGGAPGVGRGTKRDQRDAVSESTGLVPKHHPKVHPTPVEPPPRKRRNRPTTRPRRELRLTGLSLGGDEPAALEWPRSGERTRIGT